MAIKLGALASAVILSISPALAAEHVQNGGFETGDFTGWTEMDPYAGDPNLVGVDGSYPHSGSFAAYFGTEYNATFGNPTDRDTLSQTIATTAGQSYVFSFYLSNGGDFDVTPASTDSATASFGGTTLLALDPTSSSTYTLYSYTVTAYANASTLAFSFSNIPSYWNLDDVSVTDAPAPGGVPEPATWAMLVAGFGLTGSALRRGRPAFA